jgi:hypothetical protein
MAFIAYSTALKLERAKKHLAELEATGKEGPTFRRFFLSQTEIVGHFTGFGC